MFGASVVLGCVLAFASVAQCADNNEYERNFPYQRQTIDDCGERFNYLIFGSHILPAGGSPAYLREFAHIAAIGWTNEDQSVRWLCGGSLIWENFILTAAHCASDDDNVPPDVARMGDINIYSDEDDEFAQQLKIVDVIRHPKHKYYSNYYDIALMKLERNVTLHNTVAPTCLWLDDEIRFPELLAAGWGRTGFGEDTTKTLLKVQLVPINNEKCSTYYQKGDRKLENGLIDHQLCAGDEKMDTCPGDSGGPLHVKLFDGWKLTPFLVGVTSFGKACGVSAPGVYVKVSKFGDWIIETLQRHGEMATRFKFEPMVCTDRYYNLREHKENLVYKLYDGLEEGINWQNIYMSYKPSDYSIRFERQYTLNSNCSGTLIEPNVVLTTAECVLDERARPTHVVLANGKMIEVSEIIVHPSYNSSISPYYNNIAVVKLTSFAPIIPFCGWYGNPKPGRKLLITGQQLIPNEESNDYNLREIMTRVWERSSKKCRLPQEYSGLLPQGLQHEHLCFQNQPFLVPGSCNALSGSAIEQEYGDEKIYIHGINLFGRDCGYGEPAVGIRLSAHKEWLESVLLPHLKSESLVYIDPDLELGDECEYADGTKGICVAKQSCPAIHTRLQYKQQISFCSNGTVVCCSNQATNPRMMAIEKELNECEERYRHLRTDQYNEISHTVEIGWQDDRNTTYGCFGYLISTRGVVSSASCLSERADLPNIVRIGGNDSLDNSRVITIDRVIIHPNYNKKTLEHNIAIVRLETALDPTKNAFPTCLWQNLTHSPKGQIVLDFASGSTRLVNPMYKSDCEVLLNRTFEGHYMLCMNSGWRMFYPKTDQSDLQVHFEANEESSYDTNFEAGSPIVSKPYLVHVYSHGSCNLNTPCVVARVAAYIEWFKEVLQ